MREDFYRQTKSNEFFLSDVKLMDLADKSNGQEPEVVLVGKHIRRVQLEIKQDYQVDNGFIPIGERKYSAPYSTFILLLKNHRVIHFRDQPGSPDIRSLGSTIREFIRKYTRQAVKDILGNSEKSSELYTQFVNYSATLEEMKHIGETDVLLEETKHTGMVDFRKYLNDIVFPEPEVNIVPIPSSYKIEERMKDIIKIKSLNFRVYPLNAELDLFGFTSALRTATTELGAPSGSANFNGPKNIDTAGEYLKNSQGMADFVMDASTSTEKIKLRPDELTENIPVSVPAGATSNEEIRVIYDSVMERPEISNVSGENRNEYNVYLASRRIVL